MSRTIGICVECNTEQTIIAHGLCRKHYQQWHRQEKPELAAKRNERVRARNYGLTAEEYNAIVAQPCSLCGTTEQQRVVDHSHETGAVRGALCQSCNKDLHAIEHKGPKWMVNAYWYLTDNGTSLRAK